MFNFPEDEDLALRNSKLRAKQICRITGSLSVCVVCVCVCGGCGVCVCVSVSVLCVCVCVCAHSVVLPFGGEIGNAKMQYIYIFKVKSLSRVRLFVTPGTVALQAPLSMGFSRQEYWRGLPLPSPGDLPDPGVEPTSPALQTDFFLPCELTGKPIFLKAFLCIHLKVM